MRASPAAFGLILLLGCSAEPAPWFPDVAREVGLEFRHANGAAGEYQVAEVMGSGCAWLDHDRDGDLDAYLVSAGHEPAAARNRLFENGPGRAFRDVTERAGVGDTNFGMGCAVGDYDGDGFPDLYVTNFGRNTLYRNRGDGAFENATEAAGVGDERWGASAVFVDVDADGFLDLFVTNYMRHPARSRRACTDAAGRVEYCGPNAHFPPERDTLYRNLGDGTFRDATADAGLADAHGYGLGVAVLDANDDGHVDLYVANDATPNHLWLGDGAGRFVDRAVEFGAAYNFQGLAEAGMGVQAEDLNGDGYEDLVVTNLGNETNTLYEGAAGGLFLDATSKSGLRPREPRADGLRRRSLRRRPRRRLGRLRRERARPPGATRRRSCAASAVGPLCGTGPALHPTGRRTALRRPEPSGRASPRFPPLSVGGSRSETTTATATSTSS